MSGSGRWARSRSCSSSRPSTRRGRRGRRARRRRVTAWRRPTSHTTSASGWARHHASSCASVGGRSGRCFHRTSGRLPSPGSTLNPSRRAYQRAARSFTSSSPGLGPGSGSSGSSRSDEARPPVARELRLAAGAPAPRARLAGAACARSRRPATLSSPCTSCWSTSTASNARLSCRKSCGCRLAARHFATTEGSGRSGSGRGATRSLHGRRGVLVRRTGRS